MRSWSCLSAPTFEDVFEDVWAKERLHCLAQPVLFCQHDLERFKHDSNFVQVLSSPAVLQL